MNFLNSKKNISGTSFLFLFFFWAFATILWGSSLVADEKKADQNWLSNASAEQIQTVQKIKSDLEKIRPFDIVVFKKRGVEVVVERSEDVIYTKKTLQGIKKFCPNLSWSERCLYNSIKKIVFKDDPEYNTFAGKFLKGKS